MNPSSYARLIAPSAFDERPVCSCCDEVRSAVNDNGVCARCAGLCTACESTECECQRCGARCDANCDCYAFADEDGDSFAFERAHAWGKV